MFEKEYLDSKQTGNKSSDIDILKLLENDDKFDLIEVQANDLLIKIKHMIKLEMNKDTDIRIDNEFIKSLKKVIVVNNNNISDEYLEKLSYIYYALYNNSLDTYYNIQKNGEDLEYYKLDRKYNEKINYDETYDWSKYNCNQILRIAYYQNALDEVLSILKVNPNFNFFVVNKSQISKENLTNLINIFGLEMVACSDLRVLIIAANKDNLPFTKQLIEINPNIVFDCSSIFSEKVRKICDVNQLAFLTSLNKQGLDTIMQLSYKNYISDLITYYFEVIKYSPDFAFDYYDYIRNNLTFCIENSLDFPPEIFAQLTIDEHNAFHKYRYMSTLKEKMAFNSFIIKLKNKYKKPKQLKLEKKKN